MKPAIKIAFASLLLCVFALNSPAQTLATTPPASFFPAGVTNLPVMPFIEQIGIWGTSYNTNYAWVNGLQIDTGVATTTGASVQDRLNLLDNIGNFQAGVSGQFLGTGSAFDQLEGVVGYALVNKYDLKVCFQVGGGYDFNKTNNKGVKAGAIVGEPGLAAYKLITANTYATAAYTFPIESVGKFDATGTFYVGAGFTF